MRPELQKRVVAVLREAAEDPALAPELREEARQTAERLEGADKPGRDTPQAG